MEKGFLPILNMKICDFRKPNIENSSTDIQSEIISAQTVHSKDLNYSLIFEISAELIYA